MTCGEFDAPVDIVRADLTQFVRDLLDERLLVD